MEGIINSMTPLRRKPDLIKACANAVSPLARAYMCREVNRLLNQFEQTQTMMKKFSQGGMGKLMRGLGGRCQGMKASSRDCAETG